MEFRRVLFRSLLKSGEGTLALEGANSFSGGLNIEQGTVSASSSTSLGSNGNNVSLSNNATLLASASFAMGQNLVLSSGGGTITAAGSTAFTINGRVRDWKRVG